MRSSCATQMTVWKVHYRFYDFMTFNRIIVFMGGDLVESSIWHLDWENKIQFFRAHSLAQEFGDSKRTAGATYLLGETGRRGSMESEHSITSARAGESLEAILSIGHHVQVDSIRTGRFVRFHSTKGFSSQWIFLIGPSI